MFVPNNRILSSVVLELLDNGVLLRMDDWLVSWRLMDLLQDLHVTCVVRRVLCVLSLNSLLVVRIVYSVVHHARYCLNVISPLSFTPIPLAITQNYFTTA